MRSPLSIPPGYMRRVLVEELRISPLGLRVLDIGCGGGLLAEEFARLGCVGGSGPFEESLAAARKHAMSQGWRSGTSAHEEKRSLCRCKLRCGVLL
jgi:2-polyprenyl-3-methyl-5-hydroxy-6-metoxy-1,4-benzoquinol methylase